LRVTPRSPRPSSPIPPDCHRGKIKNG
jgi:hypothetical protein